MKTTPPSGCRSTLGIETDKRVLVRYRDMTRVDLCPYGEACRIVTGVADIELLLSRFHSLLEPGGFIAIADLDREDGTFHDEPAGVHHHGFVPNFLSRKMMDAGFTYVTMDTVHSIRKTREAGIIEYPVFCAVGRMRDAGSDPEQTT